MCVACSKIEAQSEFEGQCNMATLFIYKSFTTAVGENNNNNEFEYNAESSTSLIIIFLFQNNLSLNKHFPAACLPRAGCNFPYFYCTIFLVLFYFSLLNRLMIRVCFLQVKIQGQNEEMLLAACEQFLGKTEEEIQQVALETLEGHQRAIMGSMTVEVRAIYKQ